MVSPELEICVNHSSMSLDTSAFCRIVVQGELDECLADRLGSLRVQVTKPPGDQRFSILEGSIVDQAALLGVLNALYARGLPLLEVRVLPLESTGPAPSLFQNAPHAKSES